MQNLLQQFSLQGEVKWIKTKNGKVIEESDWQKNKILTSDARGLSILLDLLYGDDTYSGEITHADIGDDNTAVNAATDTGCLNALERATVASKSKSGLTRTFRFFYPDALTSDDTYYEFSMFIDGTATVDTGRAFNRIVMTTPLVKASGEDHTIVCRITGAVV